VRIGQTSRQKKSLGKRENRISELLLPHLCVTCFVVAVVVVAVVVVVGSSGIVCRPLFRTICLAIAPWLLERNFIFLGQNTRIDFDVLLF
jgi:hypothetical protein